MEKNMFGESIDRKRGYKTYGMPSHAHGLKPFTVYSRATSVFPDETSKHGYTRKQYYNEETGVMIDYNYNKTRKYFMSDPEDHKEYWNNRAKVKKAFCETFYRRNK